MDSMKKYFRLLAEDKQNDPTSGVLSALLSLAAWVYGLGVGIFRWLYEHKVLPRKRLPYPVISVGNLTWGGTGKTPFVEYLARKIGMPLSCSCFIQSMVAFPSWTSPILCDLPV